MKKKTVILSIILITSIAIAGCTEAPGDRAVGFAVGQVVSPSEDKYEFNTTLNAVEHRTDDRTYTDIKIKFYTKDRTLMKSTKVENISTGDNKRITEQFNQPPVYIIILSSDFWEDKNLRVSGLKRTEEGFYTDYRITKDQHFPNDETTE